MEKETVLAKVQATLNLTDEAVHWLIRAGAREYVAQEGGAFLRQYGGQWNELFLGTVQRDITEYFRRYDLPRELIPVVKIYESYAGSWVINGAVVMAGAIGVAHTTLAGRAELSQIADGLEERKNVFKSDFERAVNQAAVAIASNTVLPAQPIAAAPAPPRSFIATNFVIDARPIRSLTPEKLFSHKIHLSVGISRSSFTLENLSDEPMRDVRIGIFANPNPQNEWRFDRAHLSFVSLLSGHQTITKSAQEFINDISRRPLDLTGSTPLYIDCWIQDDSGIYLFNFYLQ
jgi:hypothetical protein